MLFENRMRKVRSPACASFFVIGQRAESFPQFYFRFFSRGLERLPPRVGTGILDSLMGRYYAYSFYRFWPFAK